MCYSALVWADYRRYIREFGAQLDIGSFYDLVWRRMSDPKIKIPKAVEAAFMTPQTDQERAIKALIEEHAAAQATTYEQGLFAQRKRLADAERTLETKTTKAALESKRIATQKIDWFKGKLADLRRTELIEDDVRVFPMHYAPVMVMEGGRRVIKPMRYQCRPAGKPGFFDTKYPGTYNARRDSLGGFWRELFGLHHGIVVLDAFYENVPLHKAEGRDLRPGEKEENLVLEFRPNEGGPMLVACLWSHWKGAEGEPDLLSFAAITDEPPPEVAAAGHDRCVIPVRPENVDRWLDARSSDVKALDAILEDRARPFYEHRRMAA